nr:hypothetical protein [Tanacetum cinerariifolium]
MNHIATQQAALDNALVPPEKRLKIKRCNARIAFSKTQREETYQVTLEALKLSPCYPAFVITAEVPQIYMHQFLNIITKIRDTNAYSFKLDKKKCRVDTEELGYSGRCNMLSVIHTDQMHHPWRTFTAIINSSAWKEHMPYPRFTQVIINHFISKDKTISKRNRINLHIICDDSLLVPPWKARKYKKVASPSRKLSHVKEAEPVKKVKRVKRPAKKSTTAPTPGVAIRDTPGVSIPKKKAPTKADRSKGIEILSDVALSEAAQLKEATKRSKKDYHISQASGSFDGTDFKSRVPDELQRKTSNIDEGTSTKPGVLDIPTYDSVSKNESWGDSEDEHHDDSKGDDDKADTDDDANSDADDNERTDSDDDDDENPSFTLKDYDNEKHDEEYESDDDDKNMFEEEDVNLYKDVDMRSLGAKHKQEWKGDEQMTDADQNVSQEKSYEQVIKYEHVTLTSSQKTNSSKQSSSVSSDFASKFLILENVPPAVDEVDSMMNVKSHQEESSTQAPSLFTVPETAMPKTYTTHATTIPLTISMTTPPLQLTTPSPAPATVPTTTLIPALLDFSSLFGFDQRVSTLETKLYATRTALESYTKDFEKKAQEERKLYIDVVEKSSTISESLENVVLAKSSSQHKSTYEAAKSLTEFELKKILLDKIKRSESYMTAPEHKELYEGLVKSYNLDKDLFSSYGNVYSLKRDHDDKDKDEDPSAGSDRGLKKRNTSKDDEPPKGSKSKESKTSSSKGTSLRGEIKDQPNVEATPMDDWFKKPNKPPTLDHPWNDGKSINSKPPQKWISNIAKVTQPPRMFDELMSTPIEFSAYVMHNLKIDNLTQEILVGPAFNLLKGTCKSFVELEYHFKGCYKAVTDQLDWNNPEGHKYPFDLSKPLSLIEAQGLQVVPADYFFNNDLEYLKGGSSSMKYTTSTTKTKAAKYDNIEGIEDMVLTEDQTLHKFKEGDFPRLNLCDIKDLLLLLVQKKFSNLEKDVIFDLNVALWMFTRCVVILKRVKDLQLGVKSYQKKLNLTKPETFRSDISKMTPYIAYKNPQGIIYLDKYKRNGLMRLDKLYKFCDGTFKYVRNVLHDTANNPRMEYLPKRKWSNLDRKRSRIMIKAIDQQLFERRLMCILENQNRRDLPWDIPLDSVEVLSYEVSVSTEGVEELKRIVKTNGEKKEALLTLSFTVLSALRRSDNENNAIAKPYQGDSSEFYLITGRLPRQQPPRGVCLVAEQQRRGVCLAAEQQRRGVCLGAAKVGSHVRGYLFGAAENYMGCLLGLPDSGSCRGGVRVVGSHNLRVVCLGLPSQAASKWSVWLGCRQQQRGCLFSAAETAAA